MSRNNVRVEKLEVDGMECQMLERSIEEKAVGKQIDGNGRSVFLIFVGTVFALNIKALEME